MLVDRPAKDDALAAVLVIRFQDEPLAVCDDEVAQIDDLVPVRRVSLADFARPWNVLGDRGPLRRGVERRVTVVGQEREAHLLMQELRPEAVDDGHGSLKVCADERPGDIALREKLAREDTAVDEVYRLSTGAERSPRIGQILGRADDGRDPARLEVPLEHLELGERRQTAPIDDRDGGGALRARAMRAQHRRELASARWDDLTRELRAEFLHHRQRGEDFRELVVVRHSRGRLGVVFDEADDAVLADETVEPRRRRGGAETWVAQRERFLLRVEVELSAEILVVNERALEPAERRVDRLRSLVHRRVLPIADEVRPERDTQRPVAEDQAALPLPFGER